MTDGFRRVPLATEVHTFQTEIRRCEQVAADWNSEDGAVVANSGHKLASSQNLMRTGLQRSGTRMSGGKADSGDERSLW